MDEILFEAASREEGDGMGTAAPAAVALLAAEPIGPDLGAYGAAKWRGGVLGANGHIYFVPCCANRILRVDPATEAAEPVGPDLGAYGDEYKWDGGVLGANGHIYFVPCDAKRILRFNPATDAAEPVGPDLGAYNGVSKWCGGVLGADGQIYFVPYDANRIVRVDPATDAAEPVGPDLGACGAAKWRGGVLGADGHIYFLPCCAKRILRFDPATNAAEPVGPDLGAYGDYKWSGGVLGADGHIYFVPCYAKRILRFDPATNAAEPVGPDLGAYGDAKWSSGVLGADGHIYFVPYDAKRILRFEPAIDAAEPVGPDLGAYNGSGMFGAHKWRGGVLGANGHIYFVPKNANRILHLSVPEEQGPPSSSVGALDCLSHLSEAEARMCQARREEAVEALRTAMARSIGNEPGATIEVCVSRLETIEAAVDLARAVGFSAANSHYAQALARLQLAAIAVIDAAPRNDRSALRIAIEAAGRPSVTSLLFPPQQPQFHTKLEAKLGGARSRLATLEAETEEEEARIAERIRLGLNAELVWPHEYLCPISLEPMSDPVTAADGFSYERHNILRWLEEKRTSPKTNLELEHRNVVSNVTLKIIVTEFPRREHERLVSRVQSIKDAKSAADRGSRAGGSSSLEGEADLAPSPPMKRQRTVSEDDVGKKRVHEELRKLALASYADALVKAGYDDWPSLMQMEAAPLERLIAEVQMKTGHAARFRQHIQRVQKQAAVASEAGSRRRLRSGR